MSSNFMLEKISDKSSFFENLRKCPILRLNTCKFSPKFPAVTQKPYDNLLISLEINCSSLVITNLNKI